MSRFFVLLLCSLAAACTFDVRPGASSKAGGESNPQRAVLIDAGLFYPERIALPDNSALLVSVDAVTATERKTLTRFTTDLKGRQVPIPLRFSFEPRVEPQDGRGVVHELNAAVVADGRLLRLAGPVLVTVAESEARLGRIRLRPPLEAGFGQAWQCGSARVLLGAVDIRVFLGLNDALHAVEQVPAASGVRYRSREDPTLGVHRKGGETLLIRDEDEVTECQRIEALDAPISGGGNEPGWHIDVEEDSIELTSDYGQNVIEAELLQAGSSGWTTRFRGVGENGPILAAFSRKLCRDSATGVPHPYSVEVQSGSGGLVGCGGRPQDLLTGKRWRVTHLGDDRVPDGPEDDIEITIRFDADGRASGRAACNQYTSAYELSGEGLSLDAAAATRMACAEPRMSLERRFLTLLDEVQRFDIGPEGELVLIGRDGRITAVPRDR